MLIFLQFIALLCTVLYTDHIGNSLNIEERPKRIISIVPSQTEFLWDIGIRKELVGISKFCIHPDEMLKTVTKVGGTKELKLDKIRELKPDLIIGNKEENEKSQIEILQNEFNVWMSDIYDFKDAFDMMLNVSMILGKENEANKIIMEIEKSLQTIQSIFNKQKVAYFIWNKPYMLAGRNTFIDFVLNYIGLYNVSSNTGRYPQLDEEELSKLNPKYCFLSSEPFPFSDKHAKEIQIFLPESKLIFVDGEMFSWYGSRLLKLKDYIFNLKKQLD